MPLLPVHRYSFHRPQKDDRNRKGSESSVDHSENDDSITGKSTNPAGRKVERRKDDTEQLRADGDKVRSRKTVEGDVEAQDSQRESASGAQQVQVRQGRRGRKRATAETQDGEKAVALPPAKKVSRGRGRATPGGEEGPQLIKKGRKRATEGDGTPGRGGARRTKVSRKDETVQLGSEGDSMVDSQESIIDLEPKQASGQHDSIAMEPAPQTEEVDDNDDSGKLKVKRKSGSKRGKR